MAISSTEKTMEFFSSSLHKKNAKFPRENYGATGGISARNIQSEGKNTHTHTHTRVRREGGNGVHFNQSRKWFKSNMTVHTVSNEMRYKESDNNSIISHHILTSNRNDLTFH